ncbi:MAG TPA: PQQ-binding-like beta-propeller repeat protein, partial [Prolixibacteraceae bacterium]
MTIHLKSHAYSDNQTHRSPANITRIINLFIVLFILVSLSTFNAAAQKTFEWPCFHGPDRTNKSAETGLMKRWPKDGPILIWTASGLGEGYSSVAVGGGLLYTAGTNDGQTYVFCFDLEGKLAWKKPNGQAWSTTLSHARTYTGSRSTPSYDKGVVYHLGEMGRLAAFNAKTGEEVWHRELVQDFEAEQPEYGYVESVLIDGDHLFVRPFGKKGI